MESVIDAYAIHFKRLADSVCDLLNVMGRIVTHVTEIAELSIVLVSVIFYSIVTALMGATSRQDLTDFSASPTRASPLPHLVDVDNPSGHDIGTVDNSLRDIPEGYSRDASVLKVDGQIHFIPADISLANPPYIAPAIPPHLKDCELYYTTIDLEHPEDSGFLLQDRVRLTINGQRLVCAREYAKTALETLESRREINFNEEGGITLGESKRGGLELRDRVYVGPAEWLLRVLAEEP